MALNSYQQSVTDLARRLGLRGAAESQVYQRPEFQQLANQFFGAIPLPAGIDESQVVSRTGTMVEYRDAEGFVHRLERDLTGTSPRLGEVRESSTNRPAVLPQSQQQQQTTQNLQSQLTNLFSNPVALSQLDPQSLQRLQQMKAAEDQALEQQFQQQSGTAVAQLVGQGVGSSSIAGQIMNQLLQGQGLVRSQAQGQQAGRELGIQQFLTGQQGQQNQSLQQFVETLLSQGLQRDISGAQIGVQEKGLNLQNEQFFKQFQEQIRQFDEQQRMQERQALINNIFKGIATGTSLVSGLGGIFGGGGGGGLAVPIPNLGSNFIPPSSQTFGNFGFIQPRR